jgi:hypothetical protein
LEFSLKFNIGDEKVIIEAMKPDYEIVPGRGIGSILLGMTPNELVEILGSPDETYHPEDPEKEAYEIYGYDSINCSFAFNPDYQNRLFELLIENEYFHIAHEIRVGTSKEELLNLALKLQFGESCISNMSNEEFPSHELISFKKVGLDLWLDGEIVTAIQISPLVSEKGEIAWPEEPVSPSGETDLTS